MMLLALISSTFLFMVLYYVGEEWLDYYFNSSSYMVNMQKPYLESLQQYIKKNGITTKEYKKLNPWIQKNNIYYFSISKERKLIYGVLYNGTFQLDGNAQSNLHRTWQFMDKISFADTDADVFIYVKNVNVYYRYMCIIMVVIAIVTSLLIAFVGNQKIIIQLSRNMDEAEKEKKKEQEEKERLIKSLAHDVRPPLTGLTTYAEIARMDVSKRGLDTQYIDMIIRKAMEIKNLTDQLFELSVVHSQKECILEEPDTIEEAIGDYLSEFYAVLQKNNFRVNIDNLKWENVKISINTNLMSRIFDNLLDNTYKYGDTEDFVYLDITYEPERIGVIIKNKEKEQLSPCNRTGIGLKNVEFMMKQMQGTMTCQMKEQYFCVALWFPIRK